MVKKWHIKGIKTNFTTFRSFKEKRCGYSKTLCFALPKQVSSIVKHYALPKQVSSLHRWFEKAVHNTVITKVFSVG